MKQLVIHFGMAKTGSSSIQSTLAKTTSLHRFRYLFVNEVNIGRHLAVAFMSSPERMQANQKRGLGRSELLAERKAVLESLEQQLKEDADLFVLSSEMISLLDQPALVAMRDWFSSRVDSISLMGYVREPASYMESMFQQSLKAGNSRFDISRRYPDYQARFQSIERAFGRERIRYKLFAPDRFPHHCVVRDFISELGLTLNESEIVRINEGLSAPAVSLLYIYRRHGPGFGEGIGALRSNRRLVQVLRSVPGSKLRISPDLLKAVLVSKADDLAWMAERLGESIPLKFAGSDEHAVSDANDLLQIDGNTAEWLQAQTGLVVNLAKPDLAAIAKALDRLRRGISARPSPSSVGATVPTASSTLAPPADATAQWPLRGAQSADAMPEKDITVSGPDLHLQELRNKLLAGPATLEVPGLGRFLRNADLVDRTTLPSFTFHPEQTKPDMPDASGS